MMSHLSDHFNSAGYTKWPPPLFLSFFMFISKTVKAMEMKFDTCICVYTVSLAANFQKFSTTHICVIRVSMFCTL